MTDFVMKRNDTSPAIEMQLLSNAGSAVPISGATVRFHMKNAQTQEIVINAVATIVNAATGIVKYEWDSLDTLTSGRYLAEWEVTYSDSRIETFPNNGNQVIVITDDLA